MQDHTASAGNPGYFVTMGEQETERLLALHQCYQQLHTHALESQAAPLVGKTSGEQILDVACGTGGWALDVARWQPASKVIGIDLSPSLLAAATAQAAELGLKNVGFQVMDVREPFTFPDQTFTLVHARALQYVMRADRWPTFVMECHRVLQSAGVLCLTEGENVITTMPIFEHLSSLHIEASRRAGYSFSPAGSCTGVTAMLATLLRKAGLREVQSQVFAIDGSAGTEAHANFVQYFRLLFPLVLPFLLTWGVVRQEEGERLIQQACEELKAEDFCGIWYFRTAWGQKA